MTLHNTKTMPLGMERGRLPALAWRSSTRTFQPLGQLFAGLPGGDAKTRAPSPVWRGSSLKPVKFQPLPKRQAVKIWHDARRFERQTRQPGRQDGMIGRNGLAVLHAMVFDFLRYATGDLYPSRRAIAHKANISERSVDRGLAKLRAAGVLNWLRRCAEEFIDGRFQLRQLTNAYAILPPSQWRGFRAEAPAPAPDPGTWGDPAIVLDGLGLAREAAASGGGVKALCAALETDETNGLAAVLARLGRAIAARSA